MYDLIEADPIDAIKKGIYELEIQTAQNGCLG